jgi:dienelactone hydrolase
MGHRIALLAAALAALVPAGSAVAAPLPNLPTDDVVDCFAPAGDPEPGTPEWQQRDTLNQVCATLRLRDQAQSPAFGWGNTTEGARIWLERTADQAGDAGNPRGGLTTLVPGSQAADPFRTIKRWTEAGRGRVAPVSFEALNGSTLRGHVFAPPASVKRPKAGYPGVVITDGSVQGYEELYFWAAEDLAEAGYLVMTYDVQGQGDSDLAGDDCPGDCSGVPYQQAYNFHQGAEDSLSFFLGGDNPFADALDRSRVGLAGHSLGASAVSQVGQCDTRVKAIVAWDNLRAVENCDGVTIPAKYRARTIPRVPALGITNDYMFNVQPAASPPDPHAKDAGFRQLEQAGIDSQMVAIRGGTHLEYTYVPLVLPASQKGERIASYYTRAWFDRYLRGDRTGFSRLTATTFDGSIDASAIGTGSSDAAAAAASPTDRWAGNVPHTIEGVPVKDAVSFYYLSQYALRGPDGRRRTCEDMRAGC